MLTVKNFISLSIMLAILGFMAMPNVSKLLKTKGAADGFKLNSKQIDYNANYQVLDQNKVGLDENDFQAEDNNYAQDVNRSDLCDEGVNDEHIVFGRVVRVAYSMPMDDYTRRVHENYEETNFEKITCEAWVRKPLCDQYRKVTFSPNGFATVASLSEKDRERKVLQMCQAVESSIKDGLNIIFRTKNDEDLIPMHLQQERSYNLLFRDVVHHYSIVDPALSLDNEETIRMLKSW